MRESPYLRSNDAGVQQDCLYPGIIKGESYGKLTDTKNTCEKGPVHHKNDKRL